MKTKTLALVFAALFLIYLATRFFGGDRERTFDPVLVDVDTSVVTGILLSPKAEEGRTIEIDKKNGDWTATLDGKTTQVEKQRIDALLASLVKIEAQRVLAKSQDKWPEYEIGEGATHIQVKGSGKEIANFYLGGFKFDQANRSASSYLRKAGDPSVYLIDGFLAMQFNQGFNSFRNRQLLKVPAGQVNLISLEMQSAEKMGISRMEDSWYFAGMETLDSSAVAGYLSQIANLQGSEFADSFNPGSAGKIATLSLSVEGGENRELYCYASGDSLKPFVFASNQFPESFFLSDSSGLYQRTIIEFNNLLSTGQIE